MVNQFKVPVIVMLTKLEEKSRIKAHAYWPQSVDEERQEADLFIKLRKQKNLMDNLILRVLEVRRATADGSESPAHLVSHLHYTEWPDFGIPESTEVMRELIKELDIRKTSPENPIVVHCSAGIGRAGTFLAIHISLQKHLTNPEQKISIRDTVLKLRQQRHGMVQSKDQYKFVYATLREAILERNSATAAVDPKDILVPEGKPSSLAFADGVHSLEDREKYKAAVQQRRKTIGPTSLSLSLSPVTTKFLDSEDDD